MDQKKSSQRRQKRQSKAHEESFWDCSVCTFRNTAEAFKCSMCDVRKGTSTRKPRLNPQLVAQQVAQQLTATTTKPPPAAAAAARPEGNKKPQPSSSSTGNPEEKLPKKKIRNIRPRLKNVDRTQVHRQPVTVNNVTVVITEFLPKSAINNPNFPHSNPVMSGDVPTSPEVSTHSGISVNGDVIPPSKTS